MSHSFTGGYGIMTKVLTMDAFDKYAQLSREAESSDVDHQVQPPRINHEIDSYSVALCFHLIVA